MRIAFALLAVLSIGALDCTAQVGGRGQNDLIRGLSGYWRMEEVGGIRYDSSPSGNHLTDNRTVYSTMGESGLSSRYIYAVTNYLSHASTTTLQAGPIDFSISAWFYLRTYRTNTGESMVLVSKDTNNTAGAREFVLAAGRVTITNGVYFNVFKATDSGVEITNNRPSLNQWHHIVAIHSAASNMVYLYLDGVVNSKSTAGNLQAASNAEFRIGSHAFSTANNIFDGMIDEVALWRNRALTGAEVAYIYAHGRTNSFISTFGGTHPRMTEVQWFRARPTGSVATVVNDTRYCAFPGLMKSGANLFCVYYGGTAHIVTNNASIYYRASTDNGATWGAEQTAVAGTSTNAVRGADVTLLANGTALLSCFKAYSGGLLGTFTSIGTISGTTITWATPIYVTNSFFGQPATASAPIQLGNGDILLPIYGILNSGEPYYSSGLVRSTDNGNSWGNQVIFAAGTATDQYDEANGVVLPSGRVVMMVRKDVGTWHGQVITYSDDNGATWSPLAQAINIQPDIGFFSGPGKPSMLYSSAHNKIFWSGRYNIPCSVGGATGGAGTAISQCDADTLQFTPPIWYRTGLISVYTSQVLLDATTIGMVFGEEVGASDSNISFQTLTF